MLRILLASCLSLAAIRITEDADLHQRLLATQIHLPPWQPAINRLCNWRATFAKIPASNCCQSDQGFSSPAPLFQVLLQRVLISPSLPRKFGQSEKEPSKVPLALVRYGLALVIYKLYVQVKSIIKLYRQGHVWRIVLSS